MNPADLTAKPGGNSQPPATGPQYARLMIRNAEGAIVGKDVLRPTTLVGSLPGCNIQLVSPEIAPVHCALTLEPDGLHVRQLRSNFGTRVNTSPVDSACLSDGDELQLGPFTCKLETNLCPAAVPSMEVGIGCEEAERFARLVIRNRDGIVVRKDLSRHTTLVGSLQSANVQLVAFEVSPAHCLITHEAGGLHVRDLRSRSGTRVNARAMEVCRLKDGDSLAIGPFVCKVETSFIPRPPTADDDQRDARFEDDKATSLLDSERAQLAREREQLALQAVELASDRQKLSAEIAQADLDRAQLNSQRTDTEADRRRLAQETEEFQLARNALIREQSELQAERARNADESRQLEHGRLELDRAQRELERDRDLLLTVRTGLEAERVRLERERESSDVRAQQIAEQSSHIEKSLADVLREKQEFAATAAKLQTLQAAYEADRERLDSERRDLSARAEQTGAAEAVLRAEQQEFLRELERAAQIGAGLERDRLKVSQDRARLDADLQEIGNITDRLKADRARQQEEDARLTAAQAELEQHRELLSRQEASLARIAADLQERQEELVYRRQQLRAEQAFLRSGKRQFQATLHEFRAEQERFRQAVSAVKFQRKALRRQRREIRAAAAAGADLSVSTIPFHPEWVSAGWLRGVAGAEGEPPRLIDVGDTSCIYIAEETATARRFALKVISAAQADAAGRQDIELRWRSSLELDHQHVVQSYHVDHGGTALCLAMEYVEGINLREMISLHGALSWREAAGYAFQAALGLDHIHTAGQIHGNIRPSHLLIEEDGTLKVLASAISGGWTGSTLPPDQPGYNLPEAVDYVAPEQTLDSSPVDHRADIYSLGCVLYHSITGTTPFSAETVHQTVEAHRTKLPLPMRRFAPDVPKDLVLAIKKMTAKQPEDRFQTAAEAAQALAPFARRRPAWFNGDTVLASRIDRIREHLVEGIARQLLASEPNAEENKDADGALPGTGEEVIESG